MKVNTSSISFKIIVPVVLLLTAVGVTLCIAPGKMVKNRWYENEVEVVSCDVDIAMEKIEEQKQNNSKIAKAVAFLYKDFYTAGVTSSTIEILCHMAVEQMGAEHLAIFDPKGKLLTDKKYAPQVTYTKDAMAAQSGKEINVLRFQKDDLIAVCDYPVSVDGKVVAVVEVGTNLSNETFMNTFPETVGCEFTILRDNVRLHTTIDGQKGTTINNTVFEHLRLNDRWAGSVTIHGETYVAVYWPVPELQGLSLFVGENANSMDTTTASISKFITILEIVCNVLIMVLLAVLFKFMIINPLRRTQKAIDGLSTGDADLTYRLPAKGKDEIAMLANGVNKFIELLQNIMKSIFEKSDQVNIVINDLGSTAQETASATTQIMANIESVKNQANNQSSAVSNTSDLIQLSGSHMQKLEENIVAQSSDITESSAAIEQMVGNINAVTSSAEKMTDSFNELTKVINTGSANVKACTAIIKQIEEKSKGLADANNTIKAISSQTNLLAMNAMIESAHAGEAGKGFAVVADEIRKLAENSSNQATSIAENIKEIISLIFEGNHLSELSQQSFEKIDQQVTVVDPLVRQISGAMEEQSAGSTQILESLNSMKEESQTVDESSKEVGNGLIKIQKDMEMVAEVSNTILGSMDEMAAGSQQISRATQNVSELALNTKEAMEGINSLIGKFKV